MTTLSSAERQALRGLAHQLEPVVLIGNAGLSEAVLKEIDSALKAHELIKVKAAGAEREDRDAWMTQICEALAAHPVQHIGKTLVVFRPNPEKDDKPVKKPAKKGTKAAAKKPGAGKAARSPAAKKSSSPKPMTLRPPRPTTRKAVKPTAKPGAAARKSGRTPL